MQSCDEAELSAGDRPLCGRKKSYFGMPSLEVARAYAYPIQLPELL